MKFHFCEKGHFSNLPLFGLPCLLFCFAILTWQRPYASFFRVASKNPFSRYFSYTGYCGCSCLPRQHCKRLLNSHCYLIWFAALNRYIVTFVAKQESSAVLFTNWLDGKSTEDHRNQCCGRSFSSRVNKNFAGHYV